MLSPQHSEVLARDWVPPVVLGREPEVAELVRRLDAPQPHAPPPWVVAVGGPRGAGSSTVARRAAREVADRVRASRAAPPPRTVFLRAAGCRGTHGVASALLRVFDEGFDGRGFPVAEILAGFLRRMRRESRAVVLLLDDLYVGGPEVGPVLRAIAEPDRFLPEGESGIPPVWIVLAGTLEGLARAEDGLAGRWSLGPIVVVRPYEPRALRGLVEDRATRVLGRPPPLDLVARVVRRTVEGGGGASLAIDLLRRAILGAEPGGDGSPRARGRLGLPVPIESSVVRAIEDAAHDAAARVGDVRRFQAQYAKAIGAPPLPATTLWRRIVRLEQAGYVRREVRPGGEGGTRSIVRLVAPVDEWVIAPDRPAGSRRGVGSWPDPNGAATAGSTEPGSLPASWPSGLAPD